MKRLALLSSLVLICFASVVWSQSGQQPASAPAPQPNPENFVGKVTGHPTTDIRMLRYSFEPGARTNWHTHPLGQTLIVTAGCGWAQRAGGPVEEIRPGDVVWFAPGEKHWHGATATTAMTHIAVQEKLDGKPVDWMEKVSDEQYRV